MNQFAAFPGFMNYSSTNQSNVNTQNFGDGKNWVNCEKCDAWIEKYNSLWDEHDDLKKRFDSKEFELEGNRKMLRNLLSERDALREVNNKLQSESQEKDCSPMEANLIVVKELARKLRDQRNALDEDNKNCNWNWPKRMDRSRNWKQIVLKGIAPLRILKKKWKVWPIQMEIL